MLIDRRCLKCGASVQRELEQCPQCGTDMGARSSNAASNNSPSPNEIDMWQVRKREPPARLDAAKVGEREAGNVNQLRDAARGTTPQRIEVSFDKPSPLAEPKSNYVASAIKDAKAKRISVENSKSVDELKLPPKIEARVERFRETSNRLMDETAASSDASLRFITIAAVLLIITVALFFISYAMR